MHACVDGMGRVHVYSTGMVHALVPALHVHGRAVLQYRFRYSSTGTRCEYTCTRALCTFADSGCSNTVRRVHVRAWTCSIGPWWSTLVRTCALRTHREYLAVCMIEIPVQCTLFSGNISIPTSTRVRTRVGTTYSLLYIFSSGLASINIGTRIGRGVAGVRFARLPSIILRLDFYMVLRGCT